MEEPDREFYNKIKNKYFPEKKNGFFIECGANNGIAGSPTYLFETEQDWTGICIEPNPYCWKELQENRPNSKCYQKALSSSLAHTSLYIPEGATRGKQAGGGTLNKEIHKGRELEKVTVITFTYDQLIKIEEIKHVDLFILDVEGAELDVIAGIYDCEVLPEVWVIEYSKVDPNTLNEKMIKLGYAWDDVHKDNYFYRRNK